jgi:uncharacterized protein with GYD domain
MNSAPPSDPLWAKCVELGIAPSLGRASSNQRLRLFGRRPIEQELDEFDCPAAENGSVSESCRRRITHRGSCGQRDARWQGRSNMPLYMYQAAYTPESWAAQLKNPQNRVEAVGRAACEAVGGKLVGGWYCFGEYDLMIIADVPNNQSMSAIALAIGAGGAIKASKTTVLMTGTEGVAGMKQAEAVAKVYKPAR